MFPITYPEQHLAAQIIRRHGNSSNDYFKLWPDKELFFTSNGNGIIAYGVKHNIALAYGDPSAPKDEIGRTIDEFRAFSRSHRWTPVFYQTTPYYLDIYRARRFHTFRGSDDAIVELDNFSLVGRANKHHRAVLNRFEKTGATAQLFAPPVPDALIEQAQAVSNSWLSNGRRERRFSVGRFDSEYVRHTPMLAALEADGNMLGFVNIIPSYAPHTATIDMMRYRADAPNGVMDFLFLKLFEYTKRQGFRYFSMGAAPIVELPEGVAISAEEKFFYRIAGMLDNYFSMSGLRNYKAKFATIWQPEYIIYPKRLALPRLVRAMTDITELPENKKPILGKERRKMVKDVTLEMIQEIRKARAVKKAVMPPSAENHSPAHREQD